MIGFTSERRDLFTDPESMLAACAARSARTVNRFVDMSDPGTTVGKNGDFFSGEELVGTLTRKTMIDMCRKIRVPYHYLLSIEDAEFAARVVNQRIEEKRGSLDVCSMRVEDLEDRRAIIGFTSGTTYKWFTLSDFANRVWAMARQDQDLAFKNGAIEGGTARALFKSARSEASVAEIGEVVEFGVSFVNSCDGHRSFTIYPYADVVSHGYRIAHTPGNRLRVVHRGKNFEARVVRAFAEAVVAIAVFRERFVALAGRTLTEEEVSLAEKYMKNILGIKKTAARLLTENMGLFEAMDCFCAALGGAKPAKQDENALDREIDNEATVGAMFDFFSRMCREEVIAAVL